MDGDKVQRLKHDGKEFCVKGGLNIEGCEEGEGVIFQGGV